MPKQTSNGSSNAELERTLGLPAALSIGAGTMVGAGIFVFPGLAGGQAGPAATVSFAIGAVIALLVALPTAELATAMPESGGGYYFVSRGLGTLAGTLVGIGQWVGLVFASAFYLVGFGHYAIKLLEDVGVPLGSSTTLWALGAGLLLTLIGLVGTEKAGQLQNGLVGLLLTVLTLLLGYGLLDVLGLIGDQHLPQVFAPEGTLSVFTTAALIFTSYLGFAQIATVAGDIKDPGRNVPRAILGSVILVAILYIVTMFIATSLLDRTKLEELGETAMVEVARRLLATPGALAILGSGLLATLSSANASILSASRSMYALSKDRLVLDKASAVNEHFGTPHVSLLLAGVPTLALLALGRTEVLAEVASFLHLVMYGLICFSLIALRKKAYSWYDPVFRAPGYPLIPLLGGLASFALIAFMQPLSIVLGVGVLVIAVGWYYFYGRGVTLREESREEITLTAPAAGTRVLVPVALPELDAPIPMLSSLLSKVDVVLVGTYLVPEQTAVEQARDQFEEKAQPILDELASSFEQNETLLKKRLVFTQDAFKTIDRIVAEEPCDAVLIPNAIRSLQRILVAVRGEPNADRIVSFSAGLAHGGAAELLLLHITSENAETEGHALLQSLHTQITEQGVKPDRVNLRNVVSDDPVRTILEILEGYDVVIMGETEPTFQDKIFGDVPRKIARRSEKPVILVLNPKAS